MAAIIKKNNIILENIIDVMNNFKKEYNNVLKKEKLILETLNIQNDIQNEILELLKIQGDKQSDILDYIKNDKLNNETNFSELNEKQNKILKRYKN
jgi:energy-converting hydrogenase A subunit M